MGLALFVAIAALAGWVSWTLLEYVIHGILGHRFRTFVSPLHWGHHRTPAAVFTSPIAWLPLAAGIFALAFQAAGFAYGAAYGLGVLAGFLHYEFVHWRIHFREPRNPREEKLRAHHLAHHFVNPRAYFGVTTRFWDHVFRSLPRDCAGDYARGAARPPIAGASNLKASWNPAVTAAVVRQAFTKDAPRS